MSASNQPRLAFATAATYEEWIEISWAWGNLSVR
jgi:hypothetical protein